MQQQAANQNSGEVLRHLVTGKLDEFQEEFRTLHSNMDKIIARAAQLSGADVLFQDDPSGLSALALIARKVCFQQWASFQRRIYYPLQRLLNLHDLNLECLPSLLLLLWLIRALVVLVVFSASKGVKG